MPDNQQNKQNNSGHRTDIWVHTCVRAEHLLSSHYVQEHTMYCYCHDYKMTMIKLLLCLLINGVNTVIQDKEQMGGGGVHL